MEQQVFKQLEYKTISAEDSNSLDRQVNEMVMEGWKLQGGVFAFQEIVNTGFDTARYTLWSQALVKEGMRANIVCPECGGNEIIDKDTAGEEHIVCSRCFSEI